MYSPPVLQEKPNRDLVVLQLLIHAAEECPCQIPVDRGRYRHTVVVLRFKFQCYRIEAAEACHATIHPFGAPVAAGFETVKGAIGINIVEIRIQIQPAAALLQSFRQVHQLLHTAHLVGDIQPIEERVIQPCAAISLEPDLQIGDIRFLQPPGHCLNAFKGG